MITDRATVMIDCDVHERIAAFCRANEVPLDEVVEELLADLPEVAPRLSRERRTYAGAGQDERLITHGELVRRLAADRAANDLGNAGGLVPVAAPVEKRLIGPAEGMRELCPVHGWVGRFRFEQDRHELCVARDEDVPVASEQQDVAEPPTATEDDAVINRLPNGSKDYRRTAPRAHTVPTKKLTRAVLRAFDAELDDDASSELPPRPRTRAECPDVRPCPWVACRHNLFLEVDASTGSIKFNFPDREPHEVVHSCSLDEAEAGLEAGGMTLQEVAIRTNVTRERVRQLESKALFVTRAALHSARIREEHAQDLGQEDRT